MGDKEFHEMLGILFDYDDKIDQCTKSDNREEALTKIATEMGIDLEQKDIIDLVNTLDAISKIKKEYLTPRN
jgi:hypothetical protein